MNRFSLLSDIQGNISSYLISIGPRFCNLAIKKNFLSSDRILNRSPAEKFFGGLSILTLGTTTASCPVNFSVADISVILIGRTSMIILSIFAPISSLHCRTNSDGRAVRLCLHHGFKAISRPSPPSALPSKMIGTSEAIKKRSISSSISRPRTSLA